LAEGKWRKWAERFTYKRYYQDVWGALHDPTSSWDELLKYYQHWVVLLVSEAARRRSRPAEVGALKLIRAEERRHRENLSRAHRLEASYLEWANRRKQWQRRKKRRHRQGQKQRTVVQGRAVP